MKSNGQMKALYLSRLRQQAQSCRDLQNNDVGNIRDPINAVIASTYGIQKSHRQKSPNSSKPTAGFTQATSNGDGLPASRSVDWFPVKEQQLTDYRNALNEIGFQEYVFHQANLKIETGYQTTFGLLQDRPEIIAIFAASDPLVIVVQLMIELRFASLFYADKPLSSYVQIIEVIYQKYITQFIW